MKNSKLIFVVLIGLTFSCSNPNKEFIDKIKQQLKEDASGVELNYESKEFHWVDTLFAKEKLAKAHLDFNERINIILGLEFYVKDNFEKGEIFSIKYITNDRLNQLRNWERNRRNKSSLESAKIINDKSIYEYQDYYEYAFENRNESEWLTNLCAQIERTDSLLIKYDELEEGDLELLETVLWYYKRIDDFHSNHNPDPIWSNLAIELGELQEIKVEIDRLSSINPEHVISYKALNTYKINNPMLNGAEQEFKKYFLFDDKLNIIGIVDL